MELEGLKRGLKYLEDVGLYIENFVIDWYGIKEIYVRNICERIIKIRIIFLMCGMWLKVNFDDIY